MSTYLEVSISTSGTRMSLEASERCWRIKLTLNARRMKRVDKIFRKVI